MQEENTAGDIPGEAHFMRDDQHGPAFFREITDDLQNFADQLRIKRRCRFVKQHDSRVHAERPCNRRALLLTTGKESGIGVAFVKEPDLMEQCLSLFHSLTPRNAQDVYRRLDDGFQHRPMGPEIETLEDHSEPGAQPLDLTPAARL